MEKHVYNTEEGTIMPTYSILPIKDIHLRSRKVLQKDSPIIIEEQMEDDNPQHLHTDKEQGINQKHQEKIKFKSPRFWEILNLDKQLYLYLSWMI